MTGWPSKKNAISHCLNNVCQTILTLSDIFFFCKDIDECTTGTHNCHSDANCTNTKGSFYCTCHTGYSGDGVTCEGNDVSNSK